MDNHRIFFFLCLCVTVFREYSCQKFTFKDPIIFHESDSDDKTGNWSLTGQVELTQADLVVFKPKISIQTCHEVCTIDLTSCSTNVSGDEEGCHCERKFGDVHLVHVKSTAQFYQSRAKVTATIPSKDMFQSISGTSVIGELPQISRNIPEATYQVDNGLPIKLHPIENILVCPKTLLSLLVCVKEKVIGAVLEISTRTGQTISSSNTCVKMLEVYSFDKMSVHTLTFHYSESKSASKTEISLIHIKESNDCNQTAKTPTPTQEKSTQVHPSITMAQTLSSLMEIVHSLKHEFDGASTVINSTISQLSRIETTQNLISSSLPGVCISHDETMNGLNNSISSIQQKFNKLISSVSILKEDTTELKNIKFCSNGNGCETKPRTNYVHRCYRTELNETVTWYEATKKCKSIGGMLAEIRDLQSLDYFNTFVAPPFVNGVTTSYPWLGGTDEGHEGIWKWATSGEEVTVSDWREESAEPNGGQNENCLHIYGREGWNDVPCDREYGFICQKDDVSCDDWM